jgi:hypothetical protein
LRFALDLPVETSVLVDAKLKLEKAIDTDSDDNIIYLNIPEIIYIYANIFILSFG